MFTKVPIYMWSCENNVGSSFDAVINTDQIISVFPAEGGSRCSVMMAYGGKIFLDLTFTEFSERLLDLRKLPLDA